MSTDNCTQVTAACPVEATTYGYRPVFAPNILYLVIFAICTLGQLVLGIWKRLPSFTVVVTLGCLGETIGYGGRLMMHDNPWSDAGFKIQIVCLIFSPSFLAAGIYLTLKHLVRVLGPRYSRLPPRWYTWVFIGCDIVSILLQVAGGGLAASGSVTTAQTGNDLMIAGIAFQVVTMSLCVFLALDFGYAVLRAHRTGTESEKDVGDAGYTSKPGFRFYVACFLVAFICIYVRCIYRLTTHGIPELSGGWGSPLMRDETEFLVLDGAMIALASILMTIAHPGVFFPAFRAGK